MSEDVHVQRSTLWLALQQLASGGGVWRPDLLEALAGDLHELQQCWGVNLKNGLDVARYAVISNLRSHIGRLEPPKRGSRSSLSAREHAMRYRQCVAVSFNSLDDPMLRATSAIGSRRDWLDDPARGKGRLSPKQSQLYLIDAIGKIEQQIRASGYEPVGGDDASVPPTLEPADRLVGVAEDIAQEDLPQWNGRRRRVLIASSLAAGLLAASVASWYIFSGHAHSPNTGKALADPLHPIKIDSIQEQMGNDLSWVFQKPLNFAPAQLIAISNAHNFDTYSKWFIRQGAVPLLGRLDQISIEGAADTTATITDIQVEPTCTPLLKGTLFYSESAALNDLPHLGFNLESPVPTATQFGAPGEKPVAGFFDSHSISLTPGEKMTISVSAGAAHSYCEYTLRLRVLVGDKTIYQTVDDNGEKFKVTGTVMDTFSQIPLPRFSMYSALYAGGVDSPTCNDVFVAVDPKTFSPLNQGGC